MLYTPKRSYDLKSRVFKLRFNFREYMENFFENSRILAVKFKRSKTGYLNCFNARIAEVSDL
ncbi:hypothetical protein GZ693_001684 [Campylobacter coli]|nr:hypothetical protein [Campylobacter coli]EAH7460894.1 hypothetical protein [Campylobacter coli]EAI6263416.1 hypothetical protein [Campylobacter coli]EAJ4276092.1 hypothetical protein [Campylobacter coli]EAL1303525.1 hypothetical protein [Campylobacter coli]